MVEGEYRIDGGSEPYSQTQVFAVQDVAAGSADDNAGEGISDGTSALKTPLHSSNDDAAAKRAVQYVALRIQSNHGHEEFTCMYRFRVHGQLQSQQQQQRQ